MLEQHPQEGYSSRPSRSPSSQRSAAAGGPPCTHAASFFSPLRTASLAVALAVAMLAVGLVTVAPPPAEATHNARCTGTGSTNETPFFNSCTMDFTAPQNGVPTPVTQQVTFTGNNNNSIDCVGPNTSNRVIDVPNHTPSDPWIILSLVNCQSAGQFTFGSVTWDVSVNPGGLGVGLHSGTAVFRSIESQAVVNLTITSAGDVDNDGDTFTPNAGDCDDTNAAINPNAAEVDDGVDNNCDGAVDEGFDGDGDGFTPIGGGDCNDGNAAINPGAAEVDDGVDNNCSGGVDEGFDGDGDGFTPVFGNDCDDTNANAFPGNAEVDDGADNNCDGAVDEGFDGDGDGFTPIFGGDCNDGNAAINPDAAEVDDGVDNNCNGAVDEGFDSDGDGFTPVFGNDCDDANAAVNPGAAEVFDFVDNNCDGNVDEGQDDDNDGIANGIDGTGGADANAASNDIDDGLGNTATVVDRGGLNLRAQLGASIALDIVGGGAGTATLTVCAPLSGLLSLTAGDNVTLTCGSVIVSVTTGPAELSLDGGNIVATIPSGTTLTVTDNGGGSFDFDVTGTGTVTISGAVSASLPPGTSGTTLPDTAPPVITPPANIEVEIPFGDTSAPDTQTQIAAFLAGATALDDIDGAISAAPAAGTPSSFPLVPTPTTVTFEATDNAGNQAQASATVTIVEAAPLTATLTVEKHDTNGAADAAYGFTATCIDHALDSADAAFTLSPNGTAVRVISGIPIGSLCTVEETDSLGANAVNSSADGGSVSARARASALIDADGARIDFFNIFAATSSGVGGPVILGGDDLTDHGGLDSAGDPERGWLYMQRSLESIIGQVTRSGHDGTIAALGTEDGVDEAGEAVNAAASAAGLTVNHYETASAINRFFADLASGATNPAIIWTAGTGADGDLNDAGCDPSTGQTCGEALTANASAIAAFVASGGGLLSHGSGSDAYGWLSALLPGLENIDNGGDDDLYRTATGLSQFPDVSDDDFNAGPWHSHFEGSLGGLTVLVRSSNVQDDGGNDVAVVLGGSKAVLAPSPTSSSAPPQVTVTVTRAVAGDAPEGASFAFELDCFGFDDLFSLAAGESHTTAKFPANTRCTLTETDNGGATSVSGEFDGQLLTGDTNVTVTNTFPDIPEVLGIAISKTLASGDPAAVGETVSFDVAVAFQGDELVGAELIDVFDHATPAFAGASTGGAAIACEVFANTPDGSHSMVICPLGDASGGFSVQLSFTALAGTTPGRTVNEASVLNDQDGPGGNAPTTTGPVSADVEIVEVLAPLGDGPAASASAWLRGLLVVISAGLLIGVRRATVRA